MLQPRAATVGFLVAVAVFLSSCAGADTSLFPATSSPAAPGGPSATPAMSTATPAASPGRTSATGQPTPGDSNGEVVVGGTRPTVLYPPTGGFGAPAPRLIILHGWGSNGADADAYLGLGPVAAAHGFMYVHPDGTMDSSGRTFWNATNACCDFDGLAPDDSTYLADLIGEVASTAPLDASRVYVVGHSNGGFMAHRFACDHADLLAAVVSFAGATYPTESDCEPAAPVYVVQIHGQLDDTILYDGGELDGQPYPSASDTVLSWARNDGCALTGASSETRLDLALPNDDAETQVFAYSGCEPGGGAELWTIPAGPHVPDLSSTFAETVVSFLETKSRY